MRLLIVCIYLHLCTAGSAFKIKNGVCSIRNECRCNRGYSMTKANGCIPRCGNCENGVCVGPNLCICKENYARNTDGQCAPICDSGCQNGICVAPNKCLCKEGYKIDAKNQCQPISRCKDGKVCEYVSSTGCANGNYVGPNICNCNEGYMMTHNVCVPICSDGCPGGRCVAPGVCDYKTPEPQYAIDYCQNAIRDALNKLVCKAGYEKDSTGQCLPICIGGCLHGRCVAPKTCECETGYERDSSGQCQPIKDDPCSGTACNNRNASECSNVYQNSNNKFALLLELIELVNEDYENSLYETCCAMTSLASNIQPTCDTIVMTVNSKPHNAVILSLTQSLNIYLRNICNTVYTTLVEDQ